jgi:hypothetical protein
LPIPLQRMRESGRHRDVPHAIAMTSRPAWSAWWSTREDRRRHMHLTETAGHAARSNRIWLGEARRVVPVSTATALTSGPGRRCRCARPRP